MYICVFKIFEGGETVARGGQCFNETLLSPHAKEKREREGGKNCSCALRIVVRGLHCHNTYSTSIISCTAVQVS